MEKQKVILMIANSDTAINGFLALQECFESRGNIKSVIVCHQRVHIDNAVRRCEIPKERIRILKFYPNKSSVKKVQQKKYVHKKDILAVALLKAVFNVVRMVGTNIIGLTKAHTIIKNENPSVILLYADNKAEFEKFFIFWAKKKNIKTVVAPICFSSIQGILNNPTNGFRIGVNDALPISAKIVKRMKPKEERIVGRERIFWGQPFSTIIDCFMRVSAPNPWVSGSFADFVCTSYREEYEEISGELGEAAKGKLFLTGSVEESAILQGYCDREDLKQFLREKYKLADDSIVVVAFSERNLYHSRENDLHNKDIIAQSMLKCYKDVLISLHPKSNVEENRFLEKHKGCHILEEPLRKVVAAADVIGYGDISSVGKWIDMLGIRKVIWPSYSMWEKWTAHMVQEFQNQIKAVSENKDNSEGTKEIEGNMNFVDFVLNLIQR